MLICEKTGDLTDRVLLLPNSFVNELELEDFHYRKMNLKPLKLQYIQVSSKMMSVFLIDD
jgi:hypothetical protein